MATKRRRKRRDTKIIARVCRQTFTRPIPEDATILTKGGKRFARFRQAGHLIPIPEGATIVTEAGGSLAKFKQGPRWSQPTIQPGPRPVTIPFVVRNTFATSAGPGLLTGPAGVALSRKANLCHVETYPRV